MKTKKISNGYVYIYKPGHHRANTVGWVAEHVLVAEKALGIEISGKHPIHHVNEIKSDNRTCNLVVCADAAHHRIIHRRLRVQKAGGDPNRDKFCDTCKRLLLKINFGPKHGRNHQDGLSSTCRECNAMQRKKRLQAMTPEERSAVYRRGHVCYQASLTSEQRKILARKQYESNRRKAGKTPRDGFRYQAGDFSVAKVT